MISVLEEDSFCWLFLENKATFIGLLPISFRSTKKLKLHSTKIYHLIASKKKAANPLKLGFTACLFS